MRVKGPADQPQRLYSTGEVSLLLGVPASTLLEWERRGYLPRNRPAGRHRRYTVADLRRVAQVKLLAQRYRFRQQVLDALSRGEAADAETSLGLSEGKAAGEPEALSQEWLQELAAWNMELLAAQGKLALELSAAQELLAGTPSRQAADALRLTQFCVDRASDAIFWIDSEGRLVYVNEAACRSLGYSRDELIKLTVQDIDPNFHPAAWAAHWQQIKARGCFNFESLHRRKDGQVFPVEIAVNYLQHGELEYNCVFARDISERKRAEEVLRYLSFHDALTNLYNRAFFQEEMTRLEGGRDYPITLVSCDIDGLKLVNDTMGHQKGDEFLQGFATVLRSAFRRSDVVARVGGDEFAVILPRTGSEVAESLCQRLQAEVEAYNSEHPELPLGVSVGTATVKDASRPLADAMRQADAEMYRDKLHHGPSGTHSVVRALITALATKDHVAEGHVARVQAMARKMGEACKLSAREMSELELLAEVHDLGKVGVPDHILLKPGPLTEEEMAQVRQHCALGYRIARASPELAHVADLILHHHEWWNGQGYPTGLSGEDIPIACRILAIADAYDAMTTDRPYRQAMEPRMALSELSRAAGSQFDPALVRSFVARLPRLQPARSGPP